MRDMHDSGRPSPVLRRLAWACAALLLVVTTASAFIRLSRAGIGCEPWPQCYVQRAQLSAPALEALDPPAVTAARKVHRVVASTALLLVVVLVARTLARRPRLWGAGRLALGLLGLSLFLAVLGAATGASRDPAVALGNLLGGFFMVALALRLARLDASAPPGALWWLALVLLVLQIAGGGLVSATDGPVRCGEWGVCDWHGFATPVLAGVLLALAWQAWRAGRVASAATMVLLLMLQAGLGILLAASTAVPLAPALAHNVVAALLLATVVLLAPAR